MRILCGLLLSIAAAGCAAPCPPGGCGPLICVERHHYCRRFDEWHAGLAARRCAHAALREYGEASVDFRRGFVDAYVDIAHGATGAVPPIPPERYWSICFRSGCGKGRAEEWFAGYAAGAELALACFRGGTVASSGTTYITGPPHRHAILDPAGAVEGGWGCEPTGW